jgi:hypothetical protein
MISKNQKDQYQLYINSNGVRFYYKNKKLHREDGPAIVIPKDVEKYSQLKDNTLYKKSIAPIINHEGAITKYINNMYGTDEKKCNGNVFLDYLNNQNNFWNQNDMVLQKYELAWNKSAFFLEDKEYSEEEFKKFQAKKIKDELQNELPVENTNSKPKLKI